MTIIDNVNSVTQVQHKQVTFFKPTIDEIVDAFMEHYDMVNKKAKEDNVSPWFLEENKMFNETRWNKIKAMNFKYLINMEPKDYDTFNFDRVIASIELNSEKHFNMTSFMATINHESYEADYSSNEEIYKLDSNYLNYPKSGTLFHNTTKAFNCDTVGCIAGFCVANAVEWNDNKWMPTLKFNSGMHDLYETVACNFLNIPIQAGKKIFYGEANSAWSYMKYNYGADKPYDVLCWNDEDMGCGCNDIHYTDTGIELNSISSHAAVDLLKRLRDGKLVMTAKNNFQPYEPSEE